MPPNPLGRLRLRGALKMPSAYYLAPPNRKNAARSLPSATPFSPTTDRFYQLNLSLTEG